jgi:hypothetical protein
MISRLMLNLRDPMLLKPVVTAPRFRAPAPTTEGTINVSYPLHAYPPGTGPLSTLTMTIEDAGYEDTGETTGWHTPVSEHTRTMA